MGVGVGDGGSSSLTLNQKHLKIDIAQYPLKLYCIYHQLSGWMNRISKEGNLVLKMYSVA